MFEVITTGENLNYGKKGQKRNLTDSRVIVALRHGWVENKVKFVGNIRTNMKVHIPKQEEKLMPIKRINMLKTIETQTKALNRVNEKLQALYKVNSELKKLVKKYGKD